MSKLSSVNRGRVQISFDDPSLAHQAFAAECDIRNIMNKYKKTGLISHVTSSFAQYGDFTNIPDFRDAMDIVINAQDSFDSLPAEIRNRFANDPGDFLDFASKEENRDELVRLGILHKKEPIVSPPATDFAGSETV